MTHLREQAIFLHLCYSDVYFVFCLHVWNGILHFSIVFYFCVSIIGIGGSYWFSIIGAVREKVYCENRILNIFITQECFYLSPLNETRRFHFWNNILELYGLQYAFQKFNFHHYVKQKIFLKRKIGFFGAKNVRLLVSVLADSAYSMFESTLWHFFPSISNWCIWLFYWLLVGWAWSYKQDTTPVECQSSWLQQWHLHVLVFYKKLICIFNMTSVSQLN